MGQTSGQIEQHINEQRGELGQNISELQEKVKATFDWRRQTRARPFTALGIAFGAGIVLAATLPTRRSAARARSRFASYSRERASNPASPYEKRPTSDAWDKIKSSLLAVAITSARNFLAEAIPGFRDELFRAEARRPSSATHKAPELAESIYRQKANGPTDWSTHS
jgi:hypothetical protein